HAGAGQDCKITRASGVATAPVTDVLVTGGPMGPVRLLGVDPAANSVDVPRTVRPALQFSSPVEQSSVTTSSLAWVTFDGQGSAERVPFSFAVSGPQVVMTPSVKLLPNWDYWTYAGTAVCGLRAECLPNIEVNRFFTGENRWQAAQTASIGGSILDASGSESALVLDDQGRALAAWIVPGES
ncbi:Ig-like domain-containing protein, partial [Nostoc sp. NIES-2111]